MELSHAAAVSLHQKLVVIFTKKLAPIPKHSFFGDRKPTLDDYYKLNDAVLPDHIPRPLSLPFFFQNYNLFASNEFSGGKFEGRFDVACASWYWCVDKTRSFSRRHSNVLLNFLLAAIVEAWPEDTKNKEVLEFIHKFRLAFVSYNLRLPDFDEQADFLSFWYYNTKYDLIDFPSRSSKKIFAKIKEVKNDLESNMPFEAGEFLDKARLQDRTQFSQHAVVWAVKWMVEWENKFNFVEDLEKGHNASPNVFQDELSASLAGMGMSSDLPTYLTPEHFTRPETQALLKEIEEVEPADEKYSVMWMDPKDAADRILNSDLNAMLQSMKL